MQPLTSFSRDELEVAVAGSASVSETLRRLGLRAAGGNHRTIVRYAALWGVSTVHFDTAAAGRAVATRGRPLEEILVERSTYANRRALKNRLYSSGLKARTCELCGQGELWHGKRMSLILDHVNGVHDDNRLENLRIVCANCNATLETHCGKQLKKHYPERACAHCGGPFAPRSEGQRYCSRACGVRWDRHGTPRPGARRAVRPPHGELLRGIEAEGYEAVGRAHGVSGNAVRKWVRDYEAQSAQASRETPRSVRCLE